MSMPKGKHSSQQSGFRISHVPQYRVPANQPGPTDGGSTYSMNVNHYQQPPPGAASQQPPPPPQQSAGGGPPQQQQPGPPMRVTMQHAAAMQQQAPPPQQQQPPPQQQQQPPPPHQQQHPTPTSTPPSAAADMAKTALVSPNHQMQQQTMSQMAYSQRASTNGGYRMGNPSQTRLQQNRNIVQVLQSPMPVGFQPLNNMSHLQNHHQHFPVPHYHTSGRQHAQGSSQIYYPPNLLPINFGTLPYNANYYVFAPNSVGSTGQYMTATTPVRQFATAGNPAAVTAGQMPPGMGGGAGHQVAAAAAAAAAAANQQAAVSMGINPAAAVAVATQSMMQQQQQPPMQSQQHQQQQQPQPQQQHLTKHQTKRRFAIPIIDPSTMKEREDITSSPSGSSTTPPISIDSSARQTPQPGVAVSQDTSDVAADQQQQQQTPSLPPHSHTPHHTEKPPAAAGGGDETRAGPEATPNGPTSLDISETQVPISEVKPASKPQPPATEKPAAAAAVAAVAAAASSVHSQEKEAQRDSTTTPIVSASDEITTTATPRTIVNAASAKGGAAAVAANSNQSPSKSLSKKQSRAAPSESASEKSLTQSPVVATATATSTPVATPPSASDTQPKPQATADAQPTIAAVGTQPVVQSPVVEAAAAAVTKKEATAAVEVAAPKEDTPKEVKTKATAKESAPAAAVQAPAAAVEQMPSFAQMINFTRLDKTPPQVIATPPPPAAPAPALATAPEHQATNGELPTDSAEGKACQRQAMKKNKKLKEFNQKGAKKEGSEMDAFTENNLEEKEKTATTSPLTVNNKLPPSDVSSKDDLQEKLVAAKNEENIKVSALSKSDPATAAPDNNNIIGKAPAPAPTPTTLPAPQQPVLKHKYKEDQWSPLNPDGKKKYDRDFLMGLQNDPQATKKPDNLPNIDIVQLDAPNRNKFSNQMSYSSQPSRDNPHGFAPQFFKSSSLRGVRDTPPKRNSQQGKGGKGPMKAVHVSTSLREDKRLKDSENAWKPTRLKEAKDLTEEDKKTQELYKTVRSILNKLTPQKFDTLVGQVKKLPIDTRERLEGVINLVFDKAIAEPGYSKAYANMCKLVSNMEVKDSSSEKIDKNGENEKKVVFRKSLIMRCQSEFESNKNAELCSAKRLKEIDECTDPEKKRELQLSYEEEERRIRKKSVGNIRFIGELYILDMLTAPIMHRCINDLLRQHEEEPLECLCKLLTTIGKKLEIATNSVLENFKNDKSGSKPEIVSLDTYFATMKDLSRKSDNSKLSSRVRFMLQDVIDLKQNKWVPRRDENNPKTMDQIQREANRESLETSISLQAHRKQDMRGGGGGYGGDNDRRGGSGGRNRSMNQNDDKDGWQSVGSGKNYRQTSQTYSMDFHRLTMLKQVEETHNMTLGSSANFMNWRGGANAKSASIGDNKPSSMSMVTSSNKYDVLTRNTDRERDERKAPNITFKSTGGGGGGGGGGSGARISHSPSIEKERLSSDNKEDTERRSSSQRWSRVSQPSSRDHTPAPSVAPAPTPAPKASAPAPAPSADNQESLMKEIKRTAVATLEEFIGIKNFEETLQGVSAFTNPVDKKNLVKEMLDYASNTKTKPFQELGKLLVELVKVEYLTADPLLLTVFNEYIAYQIENEMWMDCPKIFQYISEVIVPLVQSSILSFSNLADLCKRQKDANDISTIHMKKMVAAIIEALTKEFSHEWVKNKWTSSKVEPSDFGFDTNNADDQKTLLFLSSTRSEAPTNSRMSMNEVQTKLVGFLQNDNMKFEDICDWINTNVGDDVQKPTFISALITAICEVSFKNSKKPFSETGLKIHSNLIRQYLSRYDAQDLEVQCLISVAAFVNKMEHPQGLLLIIFNYLWEASLISIESFISWKDRDGVEEGKGVALKSLVSFFTSLKEGDLSDGAS